jgi:protein-S-isoprenylcysteine O-methyltransferase Ste14
VEVLCQAQRRQTLAASGIYSYVPYPQYVGLIMVMFGFLLRWPTLLTLAMFPVLVFMYARLARIEEREALAEFGAEYQRYVRHVPSLIPRHGDLIGGPMHGRAGWS